MAPQSGEIAAQSTCGYKLTPSGDDWHSDFRDRVIRRPYGADMTVLNPQAMSDQELERTAHAVGNALPALAHFAIAVGAAPGLVRRYTGCSVTNTSRLKKQTFDHLVTKLNQALLISGCVPLLDIHAAVSAASTEVIDPTIREPFVEELMNMADALQRMKYVLAVELEIRTSRRNAEIATIDGWEEKVQPHVARMQRISDRIVYEAKVFEQARRRYAQLAAIGQISWPSRQPIKNQLFVAPYRIAELLLPFADSARSAAREASAFERMFQPSHIRRFLGSWRSHADRVWDQRDIIMGDKAFRKTVPSHHPLTAALRPKSDLAQNRERWKADYQRAYPFLQLSVGIAQKCANDAEAARKLLLNKDTHGSTDVASAAVELGDGHVLKVLAGAATPQTPALLRGIPTIVITVR